MPTVIRAGLSTKTWQADFHPQWLKIGPELLLKTKLGEVTHSLNSISIITKMSANDFVFTQKKRFKLFYLDSKTICLSLTELPLFPHLYGTQHIKYVVYNFNFLFYPIIISSLNK